MGFASLDLVGILGARPLQLMCAVIDDDSSSTEETSTTGSSSKRRSLSFGSSSTAVAKASHSTTGPSHNRNRELTPSHSNDKLSKESRQNSAASFVSQLDGSVLAATPSIKSYLYNIEIWHERQCVPGSTE